MRAPPSREKGAGEQSREKARAGSRRRSASSRAPTRSAGRGRERKVEMNAARPCPNGPPRSQQAVASAAGDRRATASALRPLPLPRRRPRAPAGAHDQDHGRALERVRRRRQLGANAQRPSRDRAAPPGRKTRARQPRRQPLLDPRVAGGRPRRRTRPRRPWEAAATGPRRAADFSAAAGRERAAAAARTRPTPRRVMPSRRRSLGRGQIEASRGTLPPDGSPPRSSRRAPRRSSSRSRGRGPCRRSWPRSRDRRGAAGSPDATPGPSSSTLASTRPVAARGRERESSRRPAQRFDGVARSGSRRRARAGAGRPSRREPRRRVDASTGSPARPRRPQRPPGEGPTTSTARILGRGQPRSSRRTRPPSAAAPRSAAGRSTRTPRGRARNPGDPRLQTSRRCSTERRIGVNGFLISCAMIRAISAQAARRLERTTSETSSITAIRVARSAERQRHGHDAPPLAGARLELLGDRARRDALAGPPARRASPRPGKTSSSVGAVGAAAAERRRRGVGEEHAPVLAVAPPRRPSGWESSVARRSFSRESASVCSLRLRDMDRKARTSSRSSSSGGSASCGEKSPRGDGARPLDEVGHGPRDAHGQAPRDRPPRGGRRGALKAETAAVSCAASASGDALLRQQQQREQARDCARPGTPGTAESAVVISSKRLPAISARVRRAAAPRRSPTAT